VTNQHEIDPKAFRRALGNFATGVTIITTRGADGTNIGVTASSFNSLSMDPPLILWSSIKETPSCKVFEAASHFAVNILASDQMEMSNHFARQQEDKFDGVEWEAGLGGAPIFPNCAGYAFIRVHTLWSLATRKRFRDQGKVCHKTLMKDEWAITPSF